jgi:hypothetical protein
MENITLFLSPHPLHLCHWGIPLFPIASFFFSTAKQFVYEMMSRLGLGGLCQ